MEKSISRKGVDTVFGGILMDTPYQSNINFCFAENSPIAIDNNLIAPHIPCGTPDPLGPLHCAATMVESSEIVFINNKGVIRKDDNASCAHSVDNGSSVVFSE